MARILHLTVAALAFLSAPGQLCASAPTVLSAESVAGALDQAGLKADASEVEFPVSVPASSPDVPLRIGRWRKLDDKTVWVRLMCRRPKDCLPFFILLHPAESHRLWPLMEAPGATFQKTSIKVPPVLVRAGSRATLFLQNETVRIKTLVTCLENGKAGTTIRVKNPTTKRIYSAEVIDRGIVRAWF